MPPPTVRRPQSAARALVKPAAAGGKLELRLPRVPADVRTFFLVSLLAYTCYDFLLQPALRWLVHLVWR